MSYQVLARKWRPKSFNELVGQEHVVKALSNALNHQRLHHAYLFSGTRGVGKTTLARIFARAINCEQGVSEQPCGVCGSCRDIFNGCSVDLIEVDAASRTKVEDTRELLDNVQFAPTQARYKIYLIDEVHMLSGHSFNALLKTLEEPPSHVKFILATTDPQKLPVTILSRCLQFHLKCLIPEQITPHLKAVMTAESIPFSDDALALVAEAADGSMRDALSLLDQAIGHSGGDLKADSVQAMLGLVDKSRVFALLDAIARQDADKLLAECAAIEVLAPNYTSLLSEMMRMILAVAKAQFSALSAEINPEIRALAEQWTKEEAQLLYQIALATHKDLPYAPHPGRWFEMSMIRMLAFTPERADALAPAIPKVKAKIPPNTVHSVSAHQESIKPEPQGANEPAKKMPINTAEVINLNAEQWSDIVGALPLVGVAKAILLHSAVEGISNTELKLQINPQHGPMLNARIEAQITAELSTALQRPKLKVVFQMAKAVSNTPKDLADSKAKAQQAAAVEKLERSPQIQKVLQQFEGRIDANSATLVPEKS